MGRTAPMNPAPVGKPSITKIGTLKSNGTLPVNQPAGTEYAQHNFAMKAAGGNASPAQKGGLSAAATPGGEYRQVCSNC